MPEESSSACFSVRSSLSRMLKSIPLGQRIQCGIAIVQLPFVFYQLSYVPRHRLLDIDASIPPTHLQYVTDTEKAKIDELWRQQQAAVRPVKNIPVVAKKPEASTSLETVHMQTTLERNDFALVIDGTNTRLKCILYSWLPREKHFELNGQMLKENIVHEGSHLTRPYTYPAWSLTLKGGKYASVPTTQLNAQLQQCYTFAKTLLTKIGLVALARTHTFPVQFLAGSPQRVLPEVQRDHTQSAVRMSFEKSPFHVLTSSVRLITASEEAALGWGALHGQNVEAKALLRKTFPPTDNIVTAPFYAGHQNIQENGVFTAFQPDPAHPFGEHGYSLSFGGIPHKLFAHGYLSAGWTNVEKYESHCLPAHFTTTEKVTGTGEISKCIEGMEAYIRTVSNHTVPSGPHPWHLTTIKFAPVNTDKLKPGQDLLQSEGDEAYNLGSYSVKETHQYVSVNGTNISADYGSINLPSVLLSKTRTAMDGTKGLVFTSFEDSTTVIIQPVRFVGTGEWSKILPLLKVSRNNVSVEGVISARDTVCAYTKAQLEAFVAKNPAVAYTEDACFYLAHAVAVQSTLTKQDFAIVIPALNSQTTVNIASGAVLELVNALPWSVKPSSADVRLVQNLLWWKNVVVKLVFICVLGLLAWFISGIINTYDTRRRQALLDAEVRHIDQETALEQLPGPMHIVWETLQYKWMQITSSCCGYSDVEETSKTNSDHSNTVSSTNSTNYVHKARRIQEITHHYLSQGFTLRQAETMAKREVRQERKDRKNMETAVFLPPTTLLPAKSSMSHSINMLPPINNIHLSKNIHPNNNARIQNNALTFGIDRDFARHASMQQQQSNNSTVPERATSPFVMRESQASPFIMKAMPYNKQAIISSTPIMKSLGSPAVKPQSLYHMIPDMDVSASIDQLSDNSTYEFQHTDDIQSSSTNTDRTDRRGRSRGRDL